MIRRRQFITMLGTLGFGFLFVKDNIAANQSNTVQPKDYFPYLYAVMVEQSRRLGFKVKNDEKESLAYACEMIMPTKHAELAVVVALGGLGKRQLVDEYVRRRKGIAPLLYDHPVMELSDWIVPSTYRVMIFKEQFVALMGELTGHAFKKAEENLVQYFYARKNLYGLMQNVKPSLREIATPEYQKRLARDEFDALEQLLSSHAGFALQYSFCSTLADRAETLERSERMA